MKELRESCWSWVEQQLTIETVAFPFSFTVRGNGASSPLSSSFRSTKAWCGRFALPLSFAVRLILIVSALVSVTGAERGAFAFNLGGLIRDDIPVELGAWDALTFP